MKKDEHLKVLLENVDPPRFGCRIRVLAHEMWKIAVGEIDYDVLVVKCFILWPIHLWWWPKPSMFAADIPIANHQKLVREPSTWMSVQWPSCIAGGQCLPWIEKNSDQAGRFPPASDTIPRLKAWEFPRSFFLGYSAIFKVKVLVRRMVNAARSSCYCSTGSFTWRSHDPWK